MLTAVLAARNLFGESHDLWEVNTERSYHESFTQTDWQAKQQQQRTTAAARSNPLLVN